MCGLATTQAILAHPFFELDSKQDSIRKPSVKQAKKLTKLNDFAHFFYLLLLWSNFQKWRGGGGTPLDKGRLMQT